MQHPLIAPAPPRLSQNLVALRRVEDSGVFSNNGPEVQAFEAEATERLFGGHGASLAVANATLGLMIALRQAAGPATVAPRYALMPALTFAATAQAAIWAGLVPLVCDIDPDDWGACRHAEEAALRDYGDRIAVILPYATFGNAIDLARYDALKRRTGVGIVVDAAASLGTIDDRGLGFGADARFACVYSMHATKTFSVGEGGLIHSGDAELIARLRAAASFGFEAGRTASVVGLNAKLPEILALMARLKLADFGPVCAGRAAVEAGYRAALPGRSLQRVSGRRRAPQFMPVLLPPDAAPRRSAIIAALAAAGIGAGAYFSPHLGEQPVVRAEGLVLPTPVADRVAGAMLSLPLTDAMTVDDATTIVAAFSAAVACERSRCVAAVRAELPATTLIVGGGPAATALLTAAAKSGRLAAIAPGLVIVEREAGLGGGRLGRYAINSDSSAATFLSAVRDNPRAELAALIDHPTAREVARHDGGCGVPLPVAAALLSVTGDRLATIVGGAGGAVLTGHEAIGTMRTPDGGWCTRLRRLADGVEFDRLSRHVVIATGGDQPLDRLAVARVAGCSLLAVAGDRLLQSDAVLSVGGVAMVADLLAGRHDPRIAIVGGSTSALAAVVALLKAAPAIAFGAGGISLLHRRPLRPWFASAADARAADYHDFGADDICPVSGFVYRLGGFRLEARDLVLRILQVGGRTPDPRVVAHRIRGDDDAVARNAIERADVVVAAFGYCPRALAVADASGRPIILAAARGAPMVDRAARVCDVAGHPIPGLFGLGLAAGFVPHGMMGGEPSFSGQANGLWQWQNDVGRLILDQLGDGQPADARLAGSG